LPPITLVRANFASVYSRPPLRPSRQKDASPSRAVAVVAEVVIEVVVPVRARTRNLNNKDRSSPGKVERVMQTVVHVTHEAIHKIGGIGAVLHGLFTARTYLDTVKRNILVGPFWPTDAGGESRLRHDGEVL